MYDVMMHAVVVGDSTNNSLGLIRSLGEAGGFAGTELCCHENNFSTDWPLARIGLRHGSYAAGDIGTEVFSRIKLEGSF